MPDKPIPEGALVLYKGRAARVSRSGRKLDIVTDAGESVSVRLKDVVLLHPGPIGSLTELEPLQGEVKTAWELLAGSTTTLAELAELAFGTFEPGTAWAAWELVNDGLYFSGEPDAVLAHDRAQVDATISTREARATERAAWEAFVSRIDQGVIKQTDERYLEDIVDLALERRDQSRVLRDLGRAETRENAHGLLLAVGYWADSINPYPARMGADLTEASASLPELPHEPRLDLTHLPAFAIDDEGSTDPDDAISLDGETLWIHVADAAALVHPNTPADREALARGANLYLPEGTVYMLPASATEMLALGLAEVSPALSFGITLSAGDEVSDVCIEPSLVRVTRMTYDEADAQLDREPLAALHALAQRRRRWRQARGAIEIDLPEVKLRVEDGQIAITPLPNLASRGLVLEAMLLVGEAVAMFAQGNGIPVPFSVQDAPAEAERPDGPAGQYALLRSLKRSQRSSQPGPHAGLGLAAYVQATSPLRRYLDLVVHQQLRAFLRGDRPLDANELKERIGAADAAHGMVRVVERLSVAHWTHVYLARQQAWQGEGVVVDQAGSRCTVLIPELALEFQAYPRQPVQLNDRVRCELQSVNLPALEATFVVWPT